MINWLRQFLGDMQRPWKRVVQVVFDFVALTGCVWLAYVLRIGTSFVPNPWQVGFMFLAPVIAIPFFIRLGLYRAILRYLPDRVIWTIIQAMTMATIIWVVLAFLAEMSGGTGVPRSVPLIYWALGTIVTGGTRFAIKNFMAVPSISNAQGRRTLIYGAGGAGTQLAAALGAGGDANIIGFLDDNRALQGHDIAGLRVFPTNGLADLVGALSVEDIILSIPSASSSKRLEIAGRLAELPVKLHTMPAIADLAAGKYSIGQLKEIDIEDLLGRMSIAPDPHLIQSMISGKTILVSGAGGSIGSELCRLVAANGPAKIILLETSEYALYQIDKTLRNNHAGIDITPTLGSTTNKSLVDQLFAQHDIDVVFHAAAYKHVPLLEDNTAEGIRNNVLGSYCLTKAAFAAGVDHFVLISTDKAVRPSSVMGATKRWSELLVRHFADLADENVTGQRFLSVRFGNVLGSTGSVVPLFKDQIAEGGPLTLTDRAMTRYFMAIPEAAGLIVQAAALSDGGETFLLDMGEPISILALAENMIRLAGLTVRTKDNPAGDITIEVTGARPGEKLHESLYYDPALCLTTTHPKIQMAKRRNRELKDIEGAIEMLKLALDDGNAKKLRKALFDFIEKYDR